MSTSLLKTASTTATVRQARAHRGVADPCAACPHSIEAPDGPVASEWQQSTPPCPVRRQLVANPSPEVQSWIHQRSRAVRQSRVDRRATARENPYHRIATTRVKAPPRGPIQRVRRWSGGVAPAPGPSRRDTLRLVAVTFCYLTDGADGTLPAIRDVHNSTSEPGDIDGTQDNQ